jgi:exonuclease SbcD
MSGRPLRFVHASDLHLEQVPWGMARIPGHLRELALEAAYRAATRVFDVALAAQADFVALAGNVLDAARTGPRGPLFLAEQFRRLKSAGIEIYWAGGAVDPPDAWPAGIDLPDNVKRFPSGRSSSFICRREGRPIARIIGQSLDGNQQLRPADFRAEAGGPFTIVVACCQAEALDLAGTNLPYWALGGRRRAHTWTGPQQVAHYPGAPQGRQPAETGPHGCTLVEVDADGRAHLVARTTDVLRWADERIELGPAAGQAALEIALAERTGALAAASGGVPHLVTWSVTGPPALVSQLRRGTLAADLLARLQEQHGYGSPAVWSLRLAVETPAGPPPVLSDGDTLAGDFARAAAACQEDEGPLDLSAALIGLAPDDPLRVVAHIDDPPVRRHVLSEAAALGIDLLTAEGRQP